MIAFHEVTSSSRPAVAPEPSPTVFLVDDDISVRESLTPLMRWAGWDVEAFGSAREFLACPHDDAPGCLVLDMQLPDLSGLDLQQQMAAAGSALPIIFITAHGDIPTTVRAMKAGAMEFLTKPFDDQELLNAVRDAIDRSQAVYRDQAELRELRRRHESLTPRQRQVMRLVVAGLLNKQVGGELAISEITVKAHRGEVMRKMKAESLADLVRMAATLRLVHRPESTVPYPSRMPLTVGPTSRSTISAL